MSSDKIKFILRSI